MTMGRGDHRLAALTLASALVLGACATADEPGSPTGPSVPEPAPSSTLGPVDLVKAEIEVGGGPIGITAGEGSIWVVNSEFASDGAGSVSRIDPASGEVIATIEVGRVPLEVAVGEGSVWVSNSEDDTVSRIDPSSNEVVAAIDTCAAPEGISIGAGSAWVACEDDGAVARIDPSTDEVVEEIAVGLTPRFVAFAFDDVWVSNYGDGTITRIDPATNEVVAEIETAGLASAPFIVSVATEGGPELAGIDTATNELLATATVGDEGFISANQVMVFEANALWLPILGRGVVLRVTPPAATVG